MKYYIQRELNEYGPYTLADLQRYIGQGSILLTDLTRSEGMTDWVPVSQVIGNIPVPVAAVPVQPPVTPMYGGGNVYGGTGTVYTGAPTYAGQTGTPYAAGPVPPDFHWALVLVLSLVTCGLFYYVWLIVEAAYVKKIRQDSKGLVLIILSLVATFIGSSFAGVAGARNDGSPLGALLLLASIVLIYVGMFQIQNDLEDYYNTEEPIHLQLNGVMTFFFGVFYFQHHFSRISAWKKSGVLRPQGQ
jgi:hypothetical protein